MKRDFGNILESFDVVSFDIFDTLLLRPLLHPQDVWRVVEETENAPGFAKARKRADAASYATATRRGCETSLDEAYAHIPRWKRLREAELRTEERLLVANPETVELWNLAGRLGKKRVLVSDMYLPPEFIRRRLRRNGIDGWDGFFLSCERDARKTTGDLFRIMLGEMGVSPEKVLHVGDNRQSDVAVPERLGMTSFGYVPVCERFLSENPFIEDFLREKPSLAKDRLAGALAVGWHLHRMRHPDAGYWEKLGFLFGGVLGHLYVRRIADGARARGLEHLLFVGRDGYVWKQICETIAPDLQTDYAYAPRTASLAVLGATGNDPSAIQDRLRCLGEVPTRDAEEAKCNYAQYLERFSIMPEKTALVDGCSSGFSAQRLVEAALGADVFSFYLCAMAPLRTGAALYQSNLRTLPFQNFSEFLFSSPEPPILDVGSDGTVFDQSPDPFETFKTGCSEAICRGAVSCAEWLERFDAGTTPGDWMDYYDAFSRHLTAHDRIHLSFARNATDVAHRHYRPVVPEPLPRFRTVLSLFGKPVLTVRRDWLSGGIYRRSLRLFGHWTLLEKRSNLFKTM